MHGDCRHFSGIVPNRVPNITSTSCPKTVVLRGPGHRTFIVYAFECDSARGPRHCSEMLKMPAAFQGKVLGFTWYFFLVCNRGYLGRASFSPSRLGSELGSEFGGYGTIVL